MARYCYGAQNVIPLTIGRSEEYDERQDKKKEEHRAFDSRIDFYESDG